MSTAWAWWGYIISRNITSASLKSLRVPFGAADADVDIDEPPWSIPGIEPLIPGELEVVDVSLPLLQPATARAAAVAAAMAMVLNVMEVNMVVFLCEMSNELGSDGVYP
jgi:hypothetical protein